MNIGLAVSRNARHWPERVAVFDERGDLTYAGLDERSNRFGNLVTARFGLGRGDRVATFLPNRAEVVETLVGCAKAGCVYVGLNCRLEPTALRPVLENAEPGLVVADRELAPAIAPLAADLGVPLVEVDDDGPQGYEALLAASSPTPVPGRYEGSVTDELCIVYSSGTTGVPKGIVFDHAAALQHATITALEYEIDASSRYLVQIPHNSSVNITIVPCLLVGASLGFADSRGFVPEHFADQVDRNGVTHSFVVPTMLYRILEQLGPDGRFRSLRTLGYGSSSIPPERVQGLVERFGPIFVQLYGMAEIASIGTLLRKEDHERALAGDTRLFASAGRPSYGMEVRVVDGDGLDVQADERGEVIFGGPHLMRGYFRDPERTAEAVVGGWMHSGDVGVMDEDGYLYIVDRIKDLIIRGGFNIAPREIEDVLHRHPAVLEAAVVGVPDQEWGEAVRAVVTLKSGAQVSSAELVGWCRTAELASIKVPERVDVRAELPKNQVGKVDKQAVRRLVAGGGVS